MVLQLTNTSITLLPNELIFFFDERPGLVTSWGPIYFSNSQTSGLSVRPLKILANVPAISPIFSWPLQSAGLMISLLNASVSRREALSHPPLHFALSLIYPLSTAFFVHLIGEQWHISVPISYIFCSNSRFSWQLPCCARKSSWQALLRAVWAI